MKTKKILSSLLLGILLFTSSFLPGEIKVTKAAVITTIPNTSRVEKSYDNSFLSVTGYASLGVNSRSSYVGTSYYRTVSTPKQFLQAIKDASTGAVKVIEITADLNMGWNELALSSSEISTYSFITKYNNPTNGFTNPVLETSGVSKLAISNVNGLTIFSTSGRTIKHVEIKLNGSCNDIIIRNLKFDEMWQWDDAGTHKEVGWSFIKVNGANNVWIDHCKFTIAADGMVDLENGSTNVTLSWCDFGLAANEGTSSSHYIYKTIMNMESKYQAGQLNSSSSVYYKMRNAGATPTQIMAYAAWHSKCHLVGSGDKDFKNYVSPSGVEYLDGNQRLRLTLAYNRYTNVGSRLPMIRQGSGHLFNCYFDNSTHYNSYSSVPAVNQYGGDKGGNGMNARNGACIAADTCVYNYIDNPIIGAETQGQDTGNMDEPWATLFQNAYNRNLIVNSKVTKSNGTTYTGSSWDNNGVNAFTTGFTWKNKSTINNWAWSSSIVGVENMDKSNPPSTPFSFTYNTSEALPYSYQTVPLSSVVSTVTTYAGAAKITMSASDWLKISYSSGTSGIDAYSTIEAENYDSMYGVKAEACGEGGQDVGYIHNGDYLVFNNVNFGTGATGFEARVATTATGTAIEVRLDSLNGPLVGTLSVTPTGGWQTYTTQSCSVSGATGTHNVYLKFTGGSGYLFNINWFRFTKSQFPIVEAEDYDSMYGVKTEACGEGGQDVGYIHNGDYLVFNNVNINGATGFEARVATTATGTAIEIRTGSLNGTLLGTLYVSPTGGWQTYTTQSCSISGASGTQTIYLKFTGGSGYLFNINWFRFK